MVLYDDWLNWKLLPVLYCEILKSITKNTNIKNKIKSISCEYEIDLDTLLRSP